MHLFSCLNPQLIRNPHTKELMSVPCGKCPSCLAARSAKWTDKLLIESKCHKYTVFFTLTYSDDFVPRFEVDRQNNWLVDLTTSEVHTFSSLGLFKPDMADSLEYLLNRKYICYYTPYYLQLFMKRLRSLVNYNEKDPSKKAIRYFANSEYGPSTHRIHHHGLLFFESEYLANHLTECINKAWSTDSRNSVSVPFGRTTAEFVDSTTKSACYCASYVNGLYNLPKIYSKSPFRAKSVFSKCPAIGTLLPKSEELEELFTSRAVRMRCKSEIENAVVYKPLPQALKDRLYPKLKGFDKIPSDVRYRLYGLLSERKWVGIDYETFVAFLDDSLCRKSDSLTSNAVLPYYSWYPSDVRLYLDNLFVRKASLKRFFTVLNRFEYNRNLFRLSVREYLSRIEQFYIDERAADLSDQYNFQVEYSNAFDSKYLINLDPFFAKYCYNAYNENVVELIKSGFGYDKYSESQLKYVGKFTDEYKSVKSRSIERINNSHKTRCKNEYLENRDKQALNKIYG